MTDTIATAAAARAAEQAAHEAHGIDSPEHREAFDRYTEAEKAEFQAAVEAGLAEIDRTLQPVERRALEDHCEDIVDALRLEKSTDPVERARVLALVTDLVRSWGRNAGLTWGLAAHFVEAIITENYTDDDGPAASAARGAVAGLRPMAIAAGHGDYVGLTT